MPLVALPVVVIAVAFLLIWFAGSQLHLPAFQALAHNVPVVGELLLKGFTYAIDWAIAQAKAAVDGAVNGVLGLIQLPVKWYESHVDLVINSFYRTGLGFARLISHTIPSAMSTVLSITAGEINGVYTWAEGQFTGVYRYVNTEISLAEGYAQKLFAAGEAYSQQLFAAAQAYTAAGLAADAKYAQGLYQNAIGYIDTQIGATQKWVEGEIGQVTTWTGQEINALSTTLTAEFAASIAYAQALAAPIALDLARLKADCTDNLCANLGGLANVLGALAGDLGLAGLVALAGEMAHDPKGTATTVRQIFGGTATAAGDAMKAAAGF